VDKQLAIDSCRSLQPPSLKCASGCKAKNEQARPHRQRDTSIIADAAAAHRVLVAAAAAELSFLMSFAQATAEAASIDP
jgi:hypothetical protein